MVETKRQEIEDRFEKAPAIAIYGAGIVAQSVYPLIKNSFQKKFAGFLVTEYNPEDSKSQMTASMYQQPVYGIKDVSLDPETLIINVVASRFQDEIEKNLKKKGWNNFLHFTTDIKNFLYERFYAKYFQERDICISSKWLCLKSLKRWQAEIKNPFLESERNKASCFAELGTILLPACFDDFILSSELPYEYKNVNLNAFQNGIVFDCGANQGYFSVLAASKGHRVYAFEPSEVTV